jgi:hypothetical protein
MCFGDTGFAPLGLIEIDVTTAGPRLPIGRGSGLAGFLSTRRAD